MFETGSLCVALTGLELYVDQAGLDLTEVLLPLLCWDKDMCHHTRYFCSLLLGYICHSGSF